MTPDNQIVENVLSELYAMRRNDFLCDGTIYLQDETFFKIHRVVLSASSEYFKALFMTTLSEEKTEVTIPGIKRVTMQQILDYAYLQKCQITEENVYELLATSDYMGLLGLVRGCTEFMTSILRPDNCIKLMLFARARFCTDLYSKARMFIWRNFLEITKKSRDDLRQLDVNDFYEIISDDKLNTKDEEPVWHCCIDWISYDAAERKKYITLMLGAVRLGLLSQRFFKIEVKNHPFVKASENARPIIMDALKFLYELDSIHVKDGEMSTPGFAFPREPHEVIFAIGGWSQGAAQMVIESYDTRADRWIKVYEEDPAGPRAYLGTVVIDNRIYCIGGFDGREYFNSCRVFNTVNKKWTQIAPMHCKRCYISVAVLDGFIYAMGGYDGINRQNSVERYDFRTNQWIMVCPMNVQRSDASACALNGKIYITGGFNGQECLNSAECYDPDTNMWTTLPLMTSRRSGVSCIAHKNFIYVIGGFNGLSRMNTGEKFDPDSMTWSSIREMYNPRSNFGIEIIDDMIMAIGGFNGVQTISRVECYVTETNEWLEATDMGIVRSGLSANIIKDIPNIKDYLYRNRECLIEERRQRIYSNDG